MAVSAGHNWSEAEREGYLVVRAYLTSEEAARLLQPRMIAKGVDKNGDTIQESLARRKFRVNLSKQGLVSGKGKKQKDLFDSSPMLKTEALENKETQL